MDIDLGKAGKLSANGSIQLTTRRIVFHSKSNDKMDPFESYALPLHNIKNHKLIQPVFGSTIIQCKVKPSEDQAWELPKDCVHVFKAYFNEGQFSKFDNCLTLSLKQIRKTSYLKNY
mgnify:CR=1 FL=1